MNLMYVAIGWSAFLVVVYVGMVCEVVLSRYDLKEVWHRFSEELKEDEE